MSNISYVLKVRKLVCSGAEFTAVELSSWAQMYKITVEITAELEVLMFISFALLWIVAKNTQIHIGKLIFSSQALSQNQPVIHINNQNRAYIIYTTPCVHQIFMFVFSCSDLQRPIFKTQISCDRVNHVTEKKREQKWNQSRLCQWMPYWGLLSCTIDLVNRCSSYIKEPAAQEQRMFEWRSAQIRLFILNLPCRWWEKKKNKNKTKPIWSHGRSWANNCGPLTCIHTH